MVLPQDGANARVAQPDTELETPSTAPHTFRTVETTAPVEPAGRHLGEVLMGPWGVVLVAVLAGSAAYWFSASHDLNLLYADARSHLTIARRLVDGPNHGIVQLGTVWLPAPHVLLAPFVLVTAWWQSGAAAMPVGIACLAVEAVAVWSMVGRLTRSRLAGWAAVALLLTNPSLLYLHTTALTEPVLFAALLTTVAALVRWADSDRHYSGGEMAVFCGLPASVAVLSRYDGWAFVAAAAVVVVAVARLRWGSWRYAIHIARCFVTAPVIAGLWWMWFNWINFGDPLEFQRGRYSAQAQQAILIAEGKLPERHDLGLSLHTYTQSVLRVSGWAVVVLGALGVVVWAWRSRWAPRGLAPWLLLGVPFCFYVGSLYTGQAVIRLENTADGGMFNLRYGSLMTIGLVVFAGLAIGSLRGRRASRLAQVGVGVATLVIVGIQTSAGLQGWQEVPVVKEGLSQRAAGAGQYAAGEWMAQHATSGRILIDDSVNPLLPVIGAELDRVAAPFSGPRWNATLNDPTRAEWVFVDWANPADAVAKAVRDDADFDEQFVERFSEGDASVYQRRAEP